MEDKIEQICYDIEIGKIDWIEASEQLLVLFDVIQQRKLLQCFCKLANITHDTVNRDIEETIYRFNAL